MSDQNKAGNGFLDSWLTRFVAIVALAWGARGPILSALANANARLQNGLDYLGSGADRAATWLRRQTRRVLYLTLAVASLVAFLLFLGLAEKNRWLVVASGAVWIAYLIFLWIVIKTFVKGVKGLVEKGTDLASSSLGAILRKAKLAEGAEQLRVRFGDIDAVLANGFVLLPGFAEAFFLLALMPNFATLLLVGIVGLGVVASGLISAHIGDTMVDGWKLIKRINFTLFLILGVVAVVAFFLPATFAKYADPGALDAWLVNPTRPEWSYGFWGTVGGIFLIGAVAFVLSSLIKGEFGERLTLVILAVTLVAMCVGGYKAWGSGKKGNSSTATVSTTSPSPAPQPHAQPVPNPGAGNGMPMPTVSYNGTVGGGSSQGSAKPAPRRHRDPVVTVPKVTVKKRGDGLDSVRQNNAEIEALLGI